MVDSNCIFCKIANGDIPSLTLFENEKFRVIFDIAPASFGHAIILPKNHAENIYELGEEETSEIFVLAKKVAGMLKKALKCDGINILQNNGEAAGQSVFHLHVHIIPRYKEDTVHITWKPGEVDTDRLKKLIQEIKNQKE
ncbi:MAG: HIT family protein [Acetivibrio sp.]